MSKSRLELQRLSHDIEVLRQIRSLAATDGWQALAVTLQNGLKTRTDQIVDLACDEKKASVLRAQIHLLRWLLSIPSTSDQAYQAEVKRLKGLQERITVRQNVGLDIPTPEDAELERLVASQLEYAASLNQ